MWSLPDGLVELGGPVQDIGRREVEEETGLKVEIDGLLGVSDNIVFDKEYNVRYPYVLIDFLCHPVGRMPRYSSEVLAGMWVS